jgi:hypothetical protein
VAVDPRLVSVIIDETPAVIALVQSLFVKKHPTEPTPSSADVIAAWETVYSESLARDEQILRDNPET